MVHGVAVIDRYQWAKFHLRLLLFVFPSSIAIVPEMGEIDCKLAEGISGERINEMGEVARSGR